MWDKLKQFVSANVDKLLHFLVSYLLTTVVVPLTGFLGIAVVLFIGLFKEIIDEYDYGGFSLGDLVADILGLVFGMFVLLYFWSM